MGLFAGSIFEGSHILLTKCFLIMYFECLNLSSIVIAGELGVSRTSIGKFINRLYRNVDNIKYSTLFGKLGGECEFVEIAETHVISRRDAIGRINFGERYWVIG
jgi:hypothetical protein